MSTEMEKYIRKQKERLDVEEPDNSAIWNRISDGLKEDSRRRVHDNNQLLITGSDSGVWRFVTFRRIAATLLILLGLAYIAGDIVSNRYSQNVSLAAINPHLGERESMYVQDIEARMSRVNLSERQNMVINELIKELGEQDIAYREAISDLESMGNNERLVNTIFSIYERKIKLLEMIIMETNKEEIYEENRELPL